MDWRDRLAFWRMRWFPYRTYEYLGPHEDFDKQFGNREWSPPDRGPIRWLWMRRGQ